MTIPRSENANIAQGSQRQNMQSMRQEIHNIRYICCLRHGDRRQRLSAKRADPNTRRVIKRVWHKEAKAIGMQKQGRD